MEQRLTIVTLGVEDLTRSTDFYSNTLGWEKTKESNDNITFYKLNGILISLYPIKKLAEDAQTDHLRNGFKGFSLAHNARSESEVDQIFDDLRKKGVKIIKEPEKVFWGGYSGYISDPDGYLWEVAFNPYLELTQAGDVA
ncbi:VOC family protein [Fulvivirga imtechensis]|nr:VOC family protein [Fulvivirga imtechensis]